jgi:glycerol-3-phosphate dehydrogenase (NAD(P)+)
VSEIAVIGAGAWGTALAIVLTRHHAHRVRLWAYEPEVCQAIESRRENPLFLSGARVPESVLATNSFAQALDGAAMVVGVMPSHHARALYRQMKPHVHPEMLFVSATKGLENGSLLRMSQIIEEIFGEGPEGFRPRLGALSGPSFAREVVRGDPTAITIASTDESLAQQVQQEFSGPTLRLYRHHDVIGVELAGALKNIIAIAAGVVEGLGLGHNTAAALITRGLAEITRLVVACGGQAETMAGLAGLGDLVLTCTGDLSRNRSVGVELGKGRKLDEVIAGMHGMVAEGVLTTNAAVGLARQHGVEMPITEQTHALLREGKSPREAIHELMMRPFTTEVKLF